MASVSSSGNRAEGTALLGLLTQVLEPDAAREALAVLDIESALLSTADTGTIGRAHIAMALNVALFAGLLDRVPSARRYVDAERERGAKVTFDHGALRTVDGGCGGLPPGHAAFVRILEPLGYEPRGEYPLPDLRMTGLAFTHCDYPETIPQFFVSALHVDLLAEPAQDACARIFGSSTDPLSASTRLALDTLRRDGELPTKDAAKVLKYLVAAFDRQHSPPTVADYETLLEHTAEGAWIATEGNAFNHATARVPAVETLALELREAGYPLKPTVEVSTNGRVRQTAFMADKVRRELRTPGGVMDREVPGSFFEFISRDPQPGSAELDLTFDSGNATGIFAMTRGA